MKAQVLHVLHRPISGRLSLELAEPLGGRAYLQEGSHWGLVLEGDSRTPIFVVSSSCHEEGILVFPPYLFCYRYPNNRTNQS